MLLIYTQKITPRISYVFKHICTRILGFEVGFTSVIEELIAHNGPKLSYGKQPLGNEFFIQSHGLLTQQGIENQDITLKEWDGIPCFFTTSEKSNIPFDIFAASFYLLSRYEEYLPHVKDALGRYPASESLAFKHKFLEQPIVDMWAMKFFNSISEKFPEIKKLDRKTRIHPVIICKEPYAYKQKGFFRTLIGYTSDLSRLKIGRIFERTRVILNLRKDPFDTFTWLINVCKRSRNTVTFFFILGDNITFEKSFNTYRKKFKMLIKYVSDYKRSGIIFSMNALEDFNILKKEKERMEEIINRNLQFAMNDMYMVLLPDNYRNLIELEVERDFTMGYAKTPGFRASTCTPFLFYDLDFEIKTPLQIQPIALTSDSLRHLKPKDATNLYNRVHQNVEKVKGTFSVIFTNKDFSNRDYNKLFKQLFTESMEDERT
jgi:hypothetical protein